jgi:hypothetical protein
MNAKNDSTVTLISGSSHVADSGDLYLYPSRSILSESEISLVKDSDCLGEPAESREFSWKDCFAAVSCLISFGVAASVVFVQRWAVYWDFTGQLIWIGLCLTLMGWCTQPFLRRLFLVGTIQLRSSSTLQSIDATLRSDPLTSNADWSIRILLACMLAMGPGLSAAYKSCGNGQSSFDGGYKLIQIGLIGPPGMQHIGFGLSLFVNASLPWFEQPGLGRSYGLNTYVLNENTTAMLDSPMPADVQNIQSSLAVNQWMRLTGVVSTLVCSLDPNLDYNRTNLTNDFGGMDHAGMAGQMWAWNGFWNKGMFLPNKTDNTNIYFSSFNETNNQTFGDNARHYRLIRQNYTATWFITASSIQLEQATPIENQELDDKGVFSGIYVALPQLFINAMAEYDTLYRAMGDANTADELAMYAKEIKTDATLLAGAVWARFVSFVGPETWSQKSLQNRSHVLSEEQQSTILYTRPMSIEKGAATIKRSWQIIVILSAYPLILLAAFFSRVFLWPRSPIGEGFGVISLLASVDKDSRRLLDGAGLSGRLKRPLSLVFDIDKTWTESSRQSIQNAGTQATGRISTYLGTSSGPINRKLKSRTLYW